VVTQPVGEFLFRHAAGGEIEHGDHALRVGRCKVGPVEDQKGFHTDEGGALVAVNEGVVARDAVAERRGQAAQILDAVAPGLARPGERAFQQPGIAS
jgi:hypothetical protein